jgi:hypothetical protein
MFLATSADLTRLHDGNKLVDRVTGVESKVNASTRPQRFQKATNSLREPPKSQFSTA